jgi:hypothetical protein
MKLSTRRYLGLLIIIAFTAMPGWVAAKNPTPENHTTSICYTLAAPANTNWTAKDFDDTAWTKTEDAASIPAAVPKDGEVWIRIRCDLPWDLINNTYAKVFGTGPVEIYVNGKQRIPFGGFPSINRWRPHLGCTMVASSKNIFGLYVKIAVKAHPDFKIIGFENSYLNIKVGSGNYYFTSEIQ